MITVSIILCCTLWIAIFQAQSCITLDETNVCGKDFVGYPINIENITSTEQFNQVMDNLGSIESYSIFGCLSEDINHEQIAQVRYQSSFWCSFYVSDAMKSGCSAVNPKNPSIHTLCAEECINAASSVKLLLSKCSNKTHSNMLNLMGYTQFLDNTCSSFGASQRNSSSSTCSKGTELEAELCGWNSRGVAVSKCNSLKTPCCASLMNLSKSTAEPTTNSESLLEGWKIGVIVGGLLIILIATITLCYKRKNDSKSQSTDDSSKSDIKPLGDKPDARQNTELSLNMLETLETQINEDSLRILKDDRLSKFLGSKNETIPVNEEAEFKENQMLVVVEGYETSIADELELKLGDIIYCIKLFDDGWALGCNPITEKQGAFPLICTKAKKHNSYIDFLKMKASILPKDVSIISTGESSVRDSGLSIDSVGRNPFKGRGLPSP